MADGLHLALLGVAAAAGGAVNALAGGGTLITFPALLAAGIPPISANVTNTVAMCPGYLGAALAQRADLARQRGWMLRTLPAALLGGFAGGILLLMTGERLFARLVPYLILFAAGLVAAQPSLSARLLRRAGATGAADAEAASSRWAVPVVGATAVYSGYFGAGASVIVLAGLGLTLGGPLPRLNALKQTLALASNVAAALLFVATGPVAWLPALVMAAATFAGGTLGGRLAGRMSPLWLRRVVVVIGVVAGVAYLVR